MKVIVNTVITQWHSSIGVGKTEVVLSDHDLS